MIDLLKAVIIIWFMQDTKILNYAMKSSTLPVKLFLQLR